MRYPWITFILLACLRVTFQQEFVKNNLPNTAFTTPGPAGLPNDYNGDKVYLLNAIVDIQWFTNFSFYSVYLWQQAIPGGAATPSQNPIYTKSSSDSEQGGFSWQIETGTLDLGVSDVFFLALGQSTDLSVSATSHYFNISADAADVPGTQSSSAATTTSSTTTSTSTAAAPSQSVNAKGATSPGAKIGLGVGLGVGIPIILLLAGLLLLKLRTDRRKSRTRTNMYEQGPPEYPQNLSQVSAYRSPQQIAPQWSSGGHQPYELAAPSK